MGIFLSPHGPIVIEGDSDGFTVHTSYGYGRKTKQAMDSKLRDEVELNGKRMFVSSISEKDGVELTDVSDSSVVTKVQLSSVIVVPGSEARVNHPLGEFWRRTPHPPFMNEDLDDLINALKEYKQYRRDNS